jgi:hypothetical protein
MTTQQQLAAQVLPSLRDCRRSLDRVEQGLKVALALSVVVLAWAVVNGM